MGLFNFQIRKKEAKTQNDFDKRMYELKKIGDEQYKLAIETSKRIKENSKAIKETQQQINKLMCFNTK